MVRLGRINQRHCADHDNSICIFVTNIKQPIFSVRARYNLSECIRSYRSKGTEELSSSIICHSIFATVQYTSAFKSLRSEPVEQCATMVAKRWSNECPRIPFVRGVGGLHHNKSFVNQNIKIQGFLLR